MRAHPHEVSTTIKLISARTFRKPRHKKNPCCQLPAFYNPHARAPMTLERGWAEDLPFDRWLNEKIWVAESALTEEDVYRGAALAACA